MAAITATHNADVQSPGFDLALTGMTSTGSWTHFKVVRRDLSGALPDVTVRGLDYQPQTTATFAGADYEAPFSYYPLQYRLEMYINQTLDTTVTFNVTGTGYFYPAATAMTSPTLQSMATAYLRSVDTPALSKAVVVSEFSGYTRPGKVLSKSNVLGRSKSVNITDVTGGRSGTFKILVGNIPGADSLGTQEDFELLLEEGHNYLFQSVLSKSSGVKDLFFTIDNVSMERLQRQVLGVHGDLSVDTTYLDDDDWVQPVLEYTIDFTEIDRPATADVGVTNTTWQDVLDAYATWQAVLDDNATWLEVLQGTNYPH